MKEYVYSVDELLKSKSKKLEGLDEVNTINVDGKELSVAAYDICYCEDDFLLIRFYDKKKYSKKDMIGSILLFGSDETIPKNDEELIIRDGNIIVECGIKKPY